MPFLSQACVGHGEASTDPAAVCCPGYTKWDYDAKNGQAYQGFMCWTAACAGQGQWAGPGGVGNKCCTGLVNTGGICIPPQTGGSPTCATAGKVPLSTQTCCTGLQRDPQGICNAPSNTPLPGACQGTILCDVPDMVIYGGAAVVLLMLVMGGKK